MAEMSMNGAIHAAFRRDLERLISAYADQPDARRMAGLRRAWANFHDQLHHHHHSEHDYVWPILPELGVDAALVAKLDAEHDAMAAALDAADEAIKSNAPKAAHSALVTLRDVAVTHLDGEEKELDPVFAANAEHPAMKKMEKQMRKVSPLRMGMFLAWVTDGGEGVETIRSTIPGRVIAIFGNTFGAPYRFRVAPVWRS